VGLLEETADVELAVKRVAESRAFFSRRSCIRGRLLPVADLQRGEAEREKNAASNIRQRSIAARIHAFISSQILRAVTP